MVKDYAPSMLDTSPSSNSTQKPEKVIRFFVGKEFIRRFEFNDNGHSVTLYHLYPTLKDWQGRETPDRINPRSHDEECLNTPVAKAIEHTIRTAPKDFHLANRGSAVFAENVYFDPKSGIVDVVLTDIEQLHGLADGATTDAVAGKIQGEVAGGKAFRSLNDSEIPEFLRTARLHVEVIIGISDRDRIGKLVQGRNTSRQVKSWSLADFQGRFEWVKEVLDRANGPYEGRIGYEENAGKEVTILDVLSYLTLFHREWDEKGATGKRRSPTVAYSSKGRMDARLNDERLLSGYKALGSILEDILRLHDYVHANFERAYSVAQGGKHKLGKRQGVEGRLKQPLPLPLTGIESWYVIPSGLMFPLLASLRALVRYGVAGEAEWRTDPFRFFDKHGPALVGALFEQVEMLGGNPQTAGKTAAVYTSVHKEALLAVADAPEGLV